jgi:hypothetical protein
VFVWDPSTRFASLGMTTLAARWSSSTGQRALSLQSDAFSRHLKQRQPFSFISRSRIYAWLASGA